ncbi:MAG: glycosyltransferase [Patescibacteria group bacterium]
MIPHTEVAAVSAKKRLLYVITKANWGGAQRYVYDIATAAAADGHDVLVVSGTEGALIDRLKESGIATETIATLSRDVQLIKEYRSFRTLLEIVRDYQPDVIHGNSSKAGALAALAGRLLRVPRIIFTAHAWAYNERRPAWQKAVIALFHYATVLLSHTTVCVSRAIRHDASWMPFAKNRLVLIHHGVAPSALAPREEARKRLAPDLARSYAGSLWIGTIAELHPTKGLDTLIEAFASFVRTTGSSAVLVIVGEGQEWAKLEKLVQIYDLPERIVLPGFVKDASRYLSALDIFVLPSRSEALGYALLEAGQASLPSIGTRVGGIPEILLEGRTGLLVPHEDASALEEALVALAVDPGLRSRLGTALFEHVAAEFSLPSMLEETLALYR